ncbi:PglZ domain-containing protein [Marinilongibacter aquaticus]|uniref:T9SS response regulator signal transducer PorX n=1 Tax=Marinilongibacter aquaticus TaxID=2975157 RepID=UPI0021BDE4A9|nr:PglZ domain-containing protein [Marinilongibacter aquaticus]UBM59323.1 PglZ domain-containing protein [Marinilongibacter aquaticus]
MRYSILWADDEIDLLKPYIVFLQGKGYDVTPVPSGADAIDKVREERFDVVFLDEMMAGMTGLETLSEIKILRPNLPVVMITKSEEEQIMEEAIGSKIADYLIKPINPNQILLSVKKLLDNRRLVSEKTNMSYQQDFRNLAMQYNDRIGYEEWAEIYKRLVYWDLELDGSTDKSMEEVFEMQKSEANSKFAQFIEEEYEEWICEPKADKPIMSHDLMKKLVLPKVKEEDSPLFFILIDNFRYDQWRVISKSLMEYFRIEQEDTYYSILPTSTSYARNAIFAGMLPIDIARKYPNLWVNDEGENEESLNQHEEELLQKQLDRSMKGVKMSYHKVIANHHGKQLNDGFNNLLSNQLNCVVYNFVDMLSHARTDSNMIKQLAPDESAYRSITKSWIEHSPLLEFLKLIAEHKGRVIITTDHGMVRVKNPKRIVGDRNVNTNLRYKQGKNLNLDDKGDHVIEVRRPDNFGLPSPNVSTSYFFTTDDYFFAYPNNYNHYVGHYRDTFQHGGVSLEEMIIPCVYLKAK